MNITRQRYYTAILPIIIMVLGYLGYWLNTNHDVAYGPTGVAIAAASFVGLLLPHSRCADGH